MPFVAPKITHMHGDLSAGSKDFCLISVGTGECGSAAVTASLAVCCGCGDS